MATHDLLTAQEYDNRKASVLKALFLSQELGEGITPGRLRSRLNMNQDEYVELVETMCDEGIIDVLPEYKSQGQGRRSNIIHCKTVLRGPETTREMLATNFTPIATEAPNPYYVLDKSNRGPSVQLSAIGETAVLAIVDQMFKMGKRPFSRDKLAASMQVRVPFYVIDFVWGRFTIPLFEETKLNGGWEVYDSGGVKVLKRRPYTEQGVSELTSLQSAAKHSLSQGMSTGHSEFLILHDTSEGRRDEIKEAFESATHFGPMPQAIKHPKLMKIAGLPSARVRRCEEDGIEGKTPSHPFYGLFDLWQNMPDEKYRDDLLVSATPTFTTLEALTMYEQEEMGMHGEDAT